MKVEYINPFIKSFTRICTTQFNSEIQIGKLQISTTPIISNDISVIIGITNDITGQVVFAMDENSARHLASLMMMGMTVETIDEMARSAIQEFFNWVCGHSAEDFLTISPPHNIDITPPMITVGKAEMYSSPERLLMVPLNFTDSLGVELYISVKSKIE